MTIGRPSGNRAGAVALAGRYRQRVRDGVRCRKRPATAGGAPLDDAATGSVDPGFGRLLAATWFGPERTAPSVAELADVTKIDAACWQAVLDGRAFLDADMAIALALYWDEPLDYFLRLQNQYLAWQGNH